MSKWGKRNKREKAKQALDCKWCDGFYCTHAKHKGVSMYCTMNETCIHKETTRSKRSPRELANECKKTLRLMINGDAYELEYGNFYTLKNLKSGREAPLDDVSEIDLVLIEDALTKAHEELDEASTVVNMFIDQLHNVRGVEDEEPAIVDVWSTNRKENEDGAKGMDNEGCTTANGNRAAED